MRVVASILFTLSFVSCASGEDIRVLTAGSMKGALGAIAPEFEKSHNAHVTLIAGPAGALQERIIGGEPFDVFVTAAFSQAQALTDKGLTRSSVLVARNSLCVLTKSGSKIMPETLISELLRAETKLGASTPKSDPAGDYTWAFFRRLDQDYPGAFDSLSSRTQMLFGGAKPKPNAVGGDPIAEALDAGKVDVVFLYCSSAQSKAGESSRKYRAFPLPDPYAVTAEYGVTVSTQASPSAIDFMLALLSPKGQGTLRSFGFLPVTEPSSER